MHLYSTSPISEPGTNWICEYCRQYRSSVLWLKIKGIMPTSEYHVILLTHKPIKMPTTLTSSIQHSKQAQNPSKTTLTIRPNTKLNHRGGIKIGQWQSATLQRNTTEYCTSPPYFLHTWKGWEVLCHPLKTNVDYLPLLSVPTMRPLQLADPSRDRDHRSNTCDLEGGSTIHLQPKMAPMGKSLLRKLVCQLG